MPPETRSRSAAPTLLDLARAAGVSRTTASNAFNRPDQLSTELRERVMAIAREIGYAGPNPMGRMLRTGRAGAIGVVFAEPLRYAVTDPAAAAFLQGVAAVCELEDAGLLLLSAVDEEAARRTVRQAAVDGFVIHCLATEMVVVNSVLERGLPVVAVDLPGFADAPSLEIEDRAGARRATEHLARLGHRQLGLISMETRPDRYVGPLDQARRAGAVYAVPLERLAGYEEGLAGAGLDPACLRIEERFGSTRAAGADAAARLLAGTPRPTALLAMSDMLAIGALEQGRAMGLRVPEDLSVVGFDDIPLAQELSPPLTTVRQPLVDKGRIAAELLFGRRAATGPIVLPTELVVRATTAPPRPA